MYAQWFRNPKFSSKIVSYWWFITIFVDFVNLLEFSFQAILILKKDILACNVKTYGLAIWEWLFGTGTIFAKLLQEHKWICHITSGEVYFIVNLNIDLVFHFSGDNILYSASMDFSLKSWNLETQKQIDSATDHCDYVQCLAVKTG